MRNHSDKAVTAILMLILIVVIGSAALARAEDPRGEALRHQEQNEQRIGDGADDSPGLRQQLRGNADALEKAGLSAEEIAALMPEAKNGTALEAGTCLRLQQRVIELIQEGLPHEPLTAKIREGRTKGVDGAVLEGVIERLEGHVHDADRILDAAERDGMDPPRDPERRQEMTGELARHMWRGLSEGDCDQLRERARKRLQDGSCELEDFSAAASSMMRICDEGVERARARRMVGEALEQGYVAREMRELAAMIMAGHRHGADMDDVEDCLGDGMGTGEMYEHMWQHGWMGPEDHGGPGGENHGEGAGYGPGEHHQGDGTGSGGHHGGGDDDSGTGGDGGMGDGGDGGMGDGGHNGSGGDGGTGSGSGSGTGGGNG